MRLVPIRVSSPRKAEALRAKLEALPVPASKYFQKTTPIRTGNARSKTRLVGNTINADYPYATKLNEGYSRQARTGMTKPTIARIRELIRRIK